jgi:hypothetical protein
MVWLKDRLWLGVVGRGGRMQFPVFWLLISFAVMGAIEFDTSSVDDSQRAEHARIVVVGDWKTYQVLREIGFATEYLSEQRLEEQVLRMEREGASCVYCFRTNTLQDRSMIFVERMKNFGVTFKAIPDLSRLPIPAQLDMILQTVMPSLQEIDPHAASKIMERLSNYRRDWLRLYQRKGKSQSRPIVMDGLF